MQTGMQEASLAAFPPDTRTAWERRTSGIQGMQAEADEEAAKARLAATPGTREHHDAQLDRIERELGATRRSKASETPNVPQQPVTAKRRKQAAKRKIAAVSMRGSHA